MANSTAFEWLCEQLETHTSLDRLEARGTVRLTLKEAGLEASRVSFDGEAFQTVAAEDPDAVKVRNTVAKLGLLGRENISYVKAVQRSKMGTLA